MPRILIVEDNSDIALLYQRALIQHQHVVVATAEAAMSTFEQESFDLIILDMHLPEKSGLTVLQYIRSHPSKKDTKVFVISADDLLREDCRLLGIEAWMTKPIELDDLINQVQLLLN